ncbi:MAG: lysophospholipid acyltransferase family protein [Betaproteobacteria bacterium]|nr:lysophospholipid acyltransferase family protein [Betaproteobacteria bacterium]
MLRLAFSILGALPLPLNHAVGVLLGWLLWGVSPRHRRITRNNLARYCAATGCTSPAALRRRVVAESGKGMSELAFAWTAPLPRLYGVLRGATGWEHVDAAKAAGRPVILVTPHLGCYDIAGRYAETRIPITALYRPPKLAWLEPIMQAGRVRGGATTAPADASGVRQLLKTLKAGGNIMILPDQVPAPDAGGDGVWADFFGAPAFTMTLLPRLAESTGAVVLFFFAERLPWGRGYHIHVAPPLEYPKDKQAAARATNGAVEQLVALAPAQYLWGYNRYKHPAGAPLPPQGVAA